MEIEKLLHPLRKWWWLLLLSTLLAVGGSFYATERQPTYYSSHTTLIVGSSISSLNPTNNDFQLAYQLANLYANIGRREPVRDAAKQALGLNSLPDYSVTVPGNSQLIEISVVDEDPAKAQAVANELARQLIARIPENQSVNPEREQFTEEQLSFLERSIEDTQADIERLQTELAGLSGALQIEDTQNQISAMQSKISVLQSTYASLLESTNRNAINTLSVIDPADLPTRPINSDRWLYIFLSGILGMSLAVAGAYLIDYLDKSIKTIEDLTQLTDLPILARIPRNGPSSRRGGQEDVTVVDRGTPAFEAFRILASNIKFSNRGSKIRSILVASPSTGDGKSTIAANLSVIFANGEERVAIMDADLRNPSLHEILDVPNFDGFRKLMTEDITVKSVVKKTNKNPNLWAIPAESPSSSHFDILNSMRLSDVLQSITNEFNILIIDSPPAVLSEASVLAAQVDATILVVRLDHTPKDALRLSFDQLQRAGANILGLVVNDAQAMSAYGYMAYGYQYPTSDGGYRSNPVTVLARRLIKLFRSSKDQVPKDQPEAPQEGSEAAG